ncbi:hypothetical protein N7465_001086 [Penicillium sp. CMV-2018d]|nr:hypothetical protein N7465_001086 [Penicillium sp. CMV-2018d]
MQKSRKRSRLSPEVDSTTPACNQCRSRKIRCDRIKPECSTCRKAGVLCDFSASFKRTNPAKQLVQDFSSVLGRLDHVDRSLIRLTEQVESLTATSTSREEPFLLPSTQDQHEPGTNEAKGSSNASPRRQVFLTGESSEHPYGYPAALCLFGASQKLLKATLYTKSPSLSGPLAEISQNSGLRPSLMRHYETFPFRKRCADGPIAGDQRPISAPPQDVVYSLLDRYLNHINFFVPVFEADDLYAAIRECYQCDGPPINPAWLVCLNSIVLLTLQLDSQVARRSGFKTNPWSSNSQVISDALSNCYRALDDPHALSQPTVVNVQARIMLALMTREFFITSAFERACSSACQLARSMGLYRSVGMDESALKSRERLYWILYDMDKARVFFSGNSPDLHFFDSEFQPRLSTSDISPEVHFHAIASHMMTVWEEIYIGLYSARAVRSGANYRKDQVHRLQRLCDESLPLIPPLRSHSPGLRLMQLEVKYCYHVSKSLIHRCDQTNEGRQITHDHAVSALQMMTDVFEEPVTPSSCLVLGRMFQNYPLVSFHDLCVRYLTGDGAVDSASIIPRIMNLRRQLGSIDHQEVSSAYATKLHQGVGWCADLVSIVFDAGQSWQPGPFLLTPSTTNDSSDPQKSAPVGYGSAAGWLENEDNPTQEQPYPLGSFPSPDYFFDPALFESLLMEGHFAS